MRNSMNDSNNKFRLLWNFVLHENFLYGSRISAKFNGITFTSKEILQDKFIEQKSDTSKKYRIKFDNNMMTFGQVINRWKSKTEWLNDRYFSNLPILLWNNKYLLKLGFKSEPVGSVFVRINFYNYQSKKIDSLIFWESDSFVCPPETCFYKIELVNAGCCTLLFNWIDIEKIND